MSIMDRFRGKLGDEKVDEILTETEQATQELDAAGKERKALDEPVEAPAQDNAPEQEALDAEAIIAFIDERIGKALEVFAESVVEVTTKALDEERQEMQKRIDRLESQLIDVEDEYDSFRSLMPRAMQAARQRASTSGETVTKDAKTPDPPDQELFALGTLAIDRR